MRQHNTPTPTDGIVENPVPPENSAIPPDYVPQPYPAYRWHTTTGKSIVVDNEVEDTAAAAEGYTGLVPPVVENTPPEPPPLEPNPTETPAPEVPSYRRHRHDGD
jgi:hypothetical protein